MFCDADRNILRPVINPELLTDSSCTDAEVSWKEEVPTFTEAVTDPVAIWFVGEAAAPPALRANEAVRA